MVRQIQQATSKERIDNLYKTAKKLKMSPTKPRKSGNHYAFSYNRPKGM